MISKEEAKELYEGKYFYEIVHENGTIRLHGPSDDIRYINKDVPNVPKYDFVKIVNHQPVAVYTKDQILITDRIL